jgi:hypothetical protein
MVPLSATHAPLPHLPAPSFSLLRAAGALHAPLTPALPWRRCPLPQTPRAHPTLLMTALKPSYPLCANPPSPRPSSLSFPEQRVPRPPLPSVKDSAAPPPPILPTYAKWSNGTAPTPSTPLAPPSSPEPRDLGTCWVFPAAMYDAATLPFSGESGHLLTTS